MASYRISAIEKFDFAKPEEWPRWIRRFERFRQASDLVSNSEEIQISTLVYSMGDKAEDLLQSFDLKDDEAKKYPTVKGKFESYFIKRRNTIFERARFNRRKQEDSETVDEFITDLYSLAEHCGYGALRDELIRDRIVVGIKDSKLSEKLQMEPDLTLELAVTLARQSESVKKQQAVVRGTMTAVPVEAVSTRSCNRAWSQKPQTSTTNGAPPGNHKCTRCGKSPPHKRAQCPANEVLCHKCGKKGHYKHCCKSKVTIKEVTQDSGEETFLGTVTAVTDAVGTHSPWMVDVKLNSQNFEFKVDTGADVTVIPESVYSRERDGELQPSSLPLNGPTDEALDVCGQFSGLLTRNGIESQQNVYVIRNLRRALLGKPAIEALKVVALVEPIQEEEIVKQYPELFKGLGKLKDNYVIRLREDATPFALTTTRRVPIPLLPKVKEELQRMENMGVITRIEEPTDWCAGMVVVPKQNGKVRIYVDLTKLNGSVRRERHILPSVKQTLAQIGGAKYFSKLDANSGYWQIELDPESAKLTTFITPFGRHVRARTFSAEDDGNRGQH